MNIERRKGPRFPIEQFIDLSFGRENYIKATGINLSESGILCELESPLDPYSNVYILLKITEKETIELNGVIIRVDKKGKKYIAGIEFGDDLYDEDRTKLKKYLKSVQK